MMRKKKTFSKLYKTFHIWKRARKRNTRYAKGIIKKHRLSSNLTLNQLRKTKFSNMLISNKTWQFLTSSQKTERNLSFEALRLMRKDKSLNSASRVVGLSPNRIKKHLGNALKKKNSKWIARKSDSIERAMKIYSKGKVKSIIVRNSKDASLIAEYFSAVGQFLRTGNKSVLKKFIRMKIRDAEKKEHKFETNPDRLRDIDEAQEDSEFFEIYEDS